MYKYTYTYTYIVAYQLDLDGEVGGPEGDALQQRALDYICLDISRYINTHRYRCICI